MTVLSHLTSVSSNAVLTSYERESINRSISTLEVRLQGYFGSDVAGNFIFGSYTRGTILPRSMDQRSDIDYMVLFDDSSYRPSTYLAKLKRFVEDRYSTSEIRQSSPTIVLDLNHIRFELVPATRGFLTGYQIPGPASGYVDWIATDPNDFNVSLTTANTQNYSLIKPLVRLIKYWNSINGYPFESYFLEKRIVSTYFYGCYDLRDYFYKVIGDLQLGLWDAQWKIDKVNRAKKLINMVELYESMSLSYSAETELKKLIPTP